MPTLMCNYCGSKFHSAHKLPGMKAKCPRCSNFDKRVGGMMKQAVDSVKDAPFETAAAKVQAAMTAQIKKRMDLVETFIALACKLGNLDIKDCVLVTQKDNEGNLESYWLEPKTARNSYDENITDDSSSEQPNQDSGQPKPSDA